MSKNDDIMTRQLKTVISSMIRGIS